MKTEVRKEFWAGPTSLDESGGPLLPSPRRHCQHDKDSLTVPVWQASAAVKFFLWFLQENNLLKRISSINVIINLKKKTLLNKMNL